MSIPGCIFRSMQPRGSVGITSLACIICIYFIIFLSAFLDAADSDATANQESQAHTVSQLPRYSPDSKIAFLFLTRGPIPLEDIWREFFKWRANSSHYSIYVHPHGGFNFPQGSFFHGKEIKNRFSAVKWGGMSQVQAIRQLVISALEDPLNEWFCLMSESCIPLVSFNRWRNAMLGFDKSIINACAMSAGEMETDTRWRPSLDAVGLQKKHWRKSATWFGLMRQHAVLYSNWTKFDQAWEGVPCLDEHFLPTLYAYFGLDNETTCTDGLVHVSWPSLLAMHPRTYGGDDISPQLFANLHKAVGDHPGFGMQCSGHPDICHFTARKFSPDAKYALLEHIDMILDEDDHPYTGNPWDHHSDKLRVNGNGSVYYLIENSLIREIPDNITAKYMHLVLEPKPKVLSDMDRSDYRFGPPYPSRMDGIAVRTAKNRYVYLLKGGKRHGIPNMDTFNSLNQKLENVKILAESDMQQIPIGDPIPSVRRERRRLKADTLGSESGFF